MKANSKKLNAESQACAKADGLLKSLGLVVETLKAEEAQVDREMAAIREKHAAKLDFVKAQMQDLDQALRLLMKSDRGELFEGRDKVELVHGLLLYASGPHVQIPRDALGRIKEQGWIEGVRVAESVARDVVQQWPDERLAVIGAKRTTKETYSYELKDQGSGVRNQGSGVRNQGSDAWYPTPES